MTDQALDPLPDTLVTEFYSAFRSILKEKYGADHKMMGNQIRYVKMKKLLDEETVNLLSEFNKNRNRVTKDRLPIKNERAFIKKCLQIHRALIETEFAGKRRDTKRVYATTDSSTASEGKKEQKQTPSPRPRKKQIKPQVAQKPKASRFNSLSERMINKEVSGHEYTRVCQDCGHAGLFLKAPIRRIISCESCGKQLGSI